MPVPWTVWLIAANIHHMPWFFLVGSHPGALRHASVDENENTISWALMVRLGDDLLICVWSLEKNGLKSPSRSKYRRLSLMSFCEIVFVFKIPLNFRVLYINFSEVKVSGLDVLQKGILVTTDVVLLRWNMDIVGVSTVHAEVRVTVLVWRWSFFRCMRKIWHKYGTQFIGCLWLILIFCGKFARSRFRWTVVLGCNLFTIYIIKLTILCSGFNSPYKSVTKSRGDCFAMSFLVFWYFWQPNPIAFMYALVN